ncbi:MAG TPA: NAD(P)/FAD-dependent oxidoreductase [Acidimicrobiales bacterium]|nr:NAD(P)/FAD-dependent oxidoreductase [Acidimicrobiales bacterium]
MTSTVLSLSSAPAAVEHVDVLIVGAGLSGVGAAVHLQESCPTKTYAILEARAAMGGTWDLFRYPGVRSDSDMFTLGYNFRPWEGEKSIADGDDILHYINDTAREHRVDQRIRYHHRVTRAEWSSATAQWTVTIERSDTGDTVTMTCNFLWSCSGYYRYDEGFSPEFSGAERFKGPVIHPQHWPPDLAYEGKRVVVIGSGATAVTLVPAMAERAGHVTLLQRSPSYILSIPGKDGLADRLRSLLPAKLAYFLIRRKNVALATLVYENSRRRPRLVKRLIRKGLARQLPGGFDLDRHFTPSYNPWDQRLCLVPDGDLFQAIRAGQASMVTDRISSFTETGIELESGEHLDADIIITATGLNLLMMGGMELVVDGHPVSLPDTVAYKGMMLSGVPNLVLTVGYTNASWTLKADLVADYVGRLVNHMDSHGYRVCTPLPPDPEEETAPLLDLTSGYIQRSIDELPRQGSRPPWKLHQNYRRDIGLFRKAPLVDEGISFSNPEPTPKVAGDPVAGVAR